MGTFNTLIAEINCADCSKPFTQKIQFKYATTWQYDYKPGDKIIRENKRYDIGKPDIKVKVSGISENNVCPHCNFLNEEEFDVFIENDLIKGANYAIDHTIYFDTEDSYVEYE
jgi:DNA-directed RNA polymerase subunit RPC12/RpoP